jgi:hypothetical protein
MDHRAVYRGYTISLSGAGSTWSYRIEPIIPETPIAGHPVSDGHDSWSKAWFAAKSEIDRLLSSY